MSKKNVKDINRLVRLVSIIILVYNEKIFGAKYLTHQFSMYKCLRTKVTRNDLQKFATLNKK